MAAFLGDVRVALGDVNGDGIADIITGAGPTVGAHVRVFSGVDLSELASFDAYDPFARAKKFGSRTPRSRAHSLLEPTAQVLL